MSDKPLRPERESCEYRVAQKEFFNKIEYRCPTMTLFPLLLDVNKPYKEIEVNPSCYYREITMPYTDRLKQLMSPLRNQNLLFPDQIVPKSFSCFPSVVLFQFVEVHTKISSILSIKNNSQGSKYLRMKCEDHPCFKISFVSKASQKLASGMSHKFLVEFEPHNWQDFLYNISFTSEDETFSVPVLGLGPRPILDLPDIISLPLTPVKVESRKTLIIRNIGILPAAVNFSSERPFSVDPEKIYLGVGEVTTVTVSFMSTILGSWKKKLFVHYETGEELTILLEGCSELGNIYLSSYSVDFADTFINLKRDEKVTIHNDTGTIVKFQWKLNKSVEDDMKDLKRFESLYDTYKVQGGYNVKNLEYREVAEEEVLQVISERVSEAEHKSLHPDQLNFHHLSFEFIPISGEIWPGGRCETTIVFSAVEIGENSCKAYLEIGGWEERICLSVSGFAKGPEIVLNVDTIEIGDLNIMAITSLQVLAQNRGDIPGHIYYSGNQTDFGGTISCSPQYHQLMPGEIKTFIVSVSSCLIGKFVETVVFEVSESSEQLACIIMGNIIFPSVQVSEKNLDFKEVPLGFEIMKKFKLWNKSATLFTFSLEVNDDGVEAAIKVADKLKDPQLEIPKRPKEFEISPSDGVLRPCEEIEIKVYLIANSERMFNSNISVSIWDNCVSDLSVGVSYRSQYPIFKCHPDDLFLGFSFINYRYQHTITLENVSSAPGYFILSQKQGYEDSIDCDFEIYEGIIGPFKSLSIGVSFQVKILGSKSTKIALTTFGSENSNVICNVAMIGVGPVVSANSLELNWGEVILLKPSVKVLKLTNISLIPADYSICLNNPTALWKIQDPTGTLLPDQYVEIPILLNMVDVGKVVDVLVVNIENGRDISVTLSATGIGSSILVAPLICPGLVLGQLTCDITHELELIVVNKSTKVHELLWSTSENLANWSSVISDRYQGKYIKLEPYKIKVGPGDSQKIKLIAYCEEEIEVEENYFCVGVIGERGSRKLLGECTFLANFVQPKLALSKPEINFCLHVSPSDPFPKPVIDKLTVTPEFKQKIWLDFYVSPPFKFVDTNGKLLEKMSATLNESSPFEVSVFFDTTWRDDGYSWSADATLLISYRHNNCKSYIPVHGEIQYPNILLDTHNVNFGGINICGEAYREILVRNISSFSIEYSIYWDLETIRIQSGSEKEGEYNHLYFVSQSEAALTEILGLAREDS